MKAPIYPGSAVLRRAVRQNIVSFPSQIQAFLRRPAADMQCRVVLLFFVRGWTSIQIAARFDRKQEPDIGNESGKHFIASRNG